MPLIVELAPFERVAIGHVRLQNGPQRWRFEVEMRAKVVRGRDLMTREDAATEAQLFYAILLDAYLSDDPAPFAAEIEAAASRLRRDGAVPAAEIDAILASVAAESHYAALKAAKGLVQAEHARDPTIGPKPFTHVASAHASYRGEGARGAA